MVATCPPPLHLLAPLSTLCVSELLSGTLLVSCPTQSALRTARGRMDEALMSHLGRWVRARVSDISGMTSDRIQVWSFTIFICLSATGQEPCTCARLCVWRDFQVVHDGWREAEDRKSHKDQTKVWSNWTETLRPSERKFKTLKYL